MSESTHVGTEEGPTVARPAGARASGEPSSPQSGAPGQATARPGSIGYTFVSLGNRDFRYLFAGLLFTMGSIQMQSVARSYLTYDITSSPFILGLVNAGFALPMLSLALFGGAIADRLERRRVIQVSQAFAGLIALYIGLTVTAGVVTWAHLLAASMLQGIVFSFMMPARQAIIPQLVGRPLLANAMAINAAGMSAATLAAPAIGGALYAFIGPDWVFYITAAMCFAAVALTGIIHNPGRTATTARSAMLGDIKAGLAYIWRSPLVMVLLIVGLSTALLVMPFQQLLPVFVVDIYHRGPDVLGLLLSIIGMGSLVGSLAIASVGRWNRGMLLMTGTFISGIALLLVALVPVYVAAIGVMLLLGLGDAGRRTLNQALIMEVTEDQYRGRVMSVFLMNFGLMPLGVLPAGAIAEFLGPRVAVAVLAFLVLATTAIIVATQKWIRELQ